MNNIENKNIYQELNIDRIYSEYIKLNRDVNERYTEAWLQNLEEEIDRHDKMKEVNEWFYKLEQQYLKMVWNGRFNKATLSLEQMCKSVKSTEEVFRAKWYILSAMLTWIIKNNASNATIDSFLNIVRDIWFIPWYRIADTDHQSKIKMFLDAVTENNFSKVTGFKLSDYDLWNSTEWYDFIKKFEEYWNDNWENILQKIENIAYRKESFK